MPPRARSPRTRPRGNLSKRPCPRLPDLRVRLAVVLQGIEVSDRDEPGPEGVAVLDVAADADSSREQWGGVEPGGDFEVGLSRPFRADQGEDLLTVDLPR